MADKLIQVAEDFWNIRGAFRIGGVIDVGTQCSLVRLQNGNFVFLDSYTLPQSIKREVDRLTQDASIEAIINLHPFHTVHVNKMHELFPDAALYGTARHKSRFPDLPWQDVCTEEAAFHASYADDFEFSVPAGVDFIAANENIHFASVMLFHRNSRTIHVDDTLMFMRLPLAMRILGMADYLSFHPTLGNALEKRAGAAQAFREWAEALAEQWQGAENLCAAHTATLVAEESRSAPIHQRILTALAKAEKTLRSHERKFG